MVACVVAPRRPSPPRPPHARPPPHVFCPTTVTPLLTGEVGANGRHGILHGQEWGGAEGQCQQRGRVGPSCFVTLGIWSTHKDD